jgi:hypothetical protein
MTKPTDAEIEAQARRSFDPPNLTQQGVLVKLLDGDVAKAADLAQQYGGRLGTLEQRRPEKTSDATNPWSPSWRGTADEAQAEQIRFIKMGTGIANRMAYPHGMSPLGYPLVKK